MFTSGVAQVIFSLHLGLAFPKKRGVGHVFFILHIFKCF